MPKPAYDDGNAVKAFMADPKTDRGVVQKLSAAWVVRSDIVAKSQERYKLQQESGALSQSTEETRRNLRAIEVLIDQDAVRTGTVACFQYNGREYAWLKHSAVFTKLVGTFAAQTLAGPYDTDPSAADWRRFGRLPGFTNCKPKYRKPGGLFPFVRLHSHTGQQYPMAEAFEQEITKLYESARAGTRGEAFAKFSFSTKGTEVIEFVS